MFRFPHFQHCLAAHWVKCSKFCTARKNLPAKRQRPHIRTRFVSRILTSCREIKFLCLKCWHSGLPLSWGMKEVMGLCQSDPDLIWCSYSSCSYNVTEEMQMFHSCYYWISPRHLVCTRVLSWHDGMLSLLVVFQTWYLWKNLQGFSLYSLPLINVNCFKNYVYIYIKK